MMAQYWSWIAGGAAVVVIIVCALAERRRANRRDLDDTGWVPWRGLQVAAVFGLVAVLAFALHK